MAASIFYIIYAGIFNQVGWLAWACVALISIEGTILCAFKWQCPLTILCQKYTNQRQPGFDIFLPRWLAQNNKIIFTILFIIGLTLLLWRTAT